MLAMQAGYRPVILHPNQERTARTVRQADDSLDQVRIGQRSSIAFELDCQRLALRNEGL
jgi:hypothetical protein